MTGWLRQQCVPGLPILYSRQSAQSTSRTSWTPTFCLEFAGITSDNIFLKQFGDMNEGIVCFLISPCLLRVVHEVTRLKHIPVYRGGLVAGATQTRQSTQRLPDLSYNRGSRHTRYWYYQVHTMRVVVTLFHCCGRSAFRRRCREPHNPRPHRNSGYPHRWGLPTSVGLYCHAIRVHNFPGSIPVD